MARKSSQGRLTIPKDIWDIVDFAHYDTPSFGFFITEDSRVAIMHVSLGTELKYEYLGKCNFDDKHRFFVPSNVDIYLGDGNIYYFTTHLVKSCIYLYKLDNSILQKRQNLQINKLLSTL